MLNKTGLLKVEKLFKHLSISTGCKNQRPNFTGAKKNPLNEASLSSLVKKKELRNIVDVTKEMSWNKESFSSESSMFTLEILSILNILLHCFFFACDVFLIKSV